MSSAEDTSNGAQDNGVGNGVEVPEIELIIKVSDCRIDRCTAHTGFDLNFLFFLFVVSFKKNKFRRHNTHKSEIV